MDLPAGTRNYLTPDGHRALLIAIDEAGRERARAHRDGDARRVAELDQRLEALAERQALAEVVDPRRQDPTRVRFGATVRLVGDTEREVRVVGIDEADPARGWISWRAPLAQALLDAAVGDLCQVRTPRGVEEVEVADIRYAPA